MKFNIWEIENLGNDKIKNIYLDTVLYDSGLKISLVSDTHYISLFFFRFVSYRVSNESYLLEYWHTLDKSKMNGHIFYKVKNSTYFNDMAFLSADFFTIGGSEMIDHFAIFTINECVEVISDLQPIIEIVEK